MRKVACIKPGARLCGATASLKENFVQLDVIVFCSNAEYSNTTTTHSPDTLMDVTVEETFSQDVDDIMDWIFGDTDNFAVEELDLSDLED